MKLELGRPVPSIGFRISTAAEHIRWQIRIDQEYTICAKLKTGDDSLAVSVSEAVRGVCMRLNLGRMELVIAASCLRFSVWNDMTKAMTSRAFDDITYHLPASGVGTFALGHTINIASRLWRVI